MFFWVNSGMGKYGQIEHGQIVWIKSKRQASGHFTLGKC